MKAPKQTRPAAQPKVTHSFAPTDDVVGLFTAKLLSSGLTLADGAALGLSPISAEQSAGHGLWHLPALLIPYFDPFTGRPSQSRPGIPAFFRARALREPIPAQKGFSKYLQPKDTGICAYFPKLGSWKWADILNDYQFQIFITEGELKAAAACKHGFPTIGLGGVFNWASNRDGVEFLPELERIAWSGRGVTIIFDSDMSTKPDVCLALQRLADALAARGAFPKVLVLPQPTDDKVGLDDYFLDHTAADLTALLAHSARHLTHARSLWALNARWSFVEKTTSLVRHTDGDLLKSLEFSAQFTAKVPRCVLRPTGEIDEYPVKIGSEWLDWPFRSTVRQITYDPSAAPLSRVEVAPGVYDFNAWPGWGVEPAKGGVEPFLGMMRYLFTGADEADMWWLIRWLAYPVRHPGTKLSTSAIIFGRNQGTGKSSIGYTMREIYGHANFSEVGQRHLESQFNTWCVRKQFVMGDDVSGTDKREMLDLFKGMITQREIYVNEKNKPNYTIPDTVNYLWTSNHHNAFALEDQDRRFFVHEVTADPLSVEYWDHYFDWLRSGGSGAIFHYFRDVLDMADFNPHGRARGTESKAAMSTANHGTVGQYIRDLMDPEIGPEILLTLGGEAQPGVRGRDIFTSRELLLHLQDAYPDERVANKLITNQLRAVGAKQVHGGKLVAGLNGKQERFWAVRNVDKWARAELDDLTHHLLNHHKVVDLGGVRQRKPAPATKPSAKKF